MKKDRVAISAVCGLLMAVSMVMAILYLAIYQRDTAYVGGLVWSLLGFLELLLAGLSLRFCLKGGKGGVALITYIATIVLAIPILLAALVWLLYLAGLQLLPPPQR